MASTTGTNTLTYPNEDTTNWYATWEAMAQQITDYIDAVGTPSAMNDTAGNEVITTVATTNAVNYLHLINSATGNPVAIQAAGTDTNVTLALVAKGTGNLSLDGLTWPNTDGSTNQHLSTDGAGVLSWVTPASSGATNINTLSDVTITTATTNQLLQYDGSGWVNATVAAAGGATNINALSDVTITSAASNEIVQYNGSAWINQTYTEAGLVGDAVLTSPASNQVLTYNGTNWINAAAAGGGGGGWTLITSQVVTTAVASVDFTSNIDSTYSVYKLVMYNVQSSASGNAYLRISTDAGSTWKSGASDYAYAHGGQYTAQSSGATFIRISNGVLTASYGGSWTVDLMNPSSASDYFQLVGYGGGYYTSYNEGGGFWGTYKATTAVDGIQFFFSTGNVTAGFFKLYGVV